MLKSEFVSLAFHKACENDEKDLKAVQSGDTLTIRLNDKNLLLVDWPKIKILVIEVVCNICQIVTEKN